MENRRILLTGVTGYIGKRLLPILLEQGDEVICCVRDIDKFQNEIYLSHERVSIIEVDFLKKGTLSKIPKKIDVAYYLIHSMSSSVEKFTELEAECAFNFRETLDKTNVQQVIYLSGIVNKTTLSQHLISRKNVEKGLQSRHYALTTFRAGIIVGSGSASFEIIRDLVEKLPIMITPKWLNTKTQPIAVRDVLTFLSKAILKEDLLNQSFDIGSPNVLTYKEMLLGYAKVRGLKRWIFTLPVMTPKLSSYWLYFITSTSYKLAVSLVNSMKVEVIAKPSKINQILEIKPISYEKAIELAFKKIQQNSIVSSWKDASISSQFNDDLSEHIQVPHFGCYKDIKVRKVIDQEKVLNKIWSIGGENGWYYANSLWEIRGIIDQLVGGIGLRRGRTSKTELNPGDALDFWRVIKASKEETHLLLYAEMKIPGEAWLEFKIMKEKLYQRAVFRPKGVRGRLYWYMVLPFHYFIFNGMINKLVSFKGNTPE
ncbi:dTDP-glucose 4,6-dehydratase [Flavobacteriaceae bacterium UJ101]|nr:dTDP-glucose 4,6-dehydratase [Flavobacteriaceae bacterium UJ101]